MFKEDEDLEAHLDAPLELKLGGVEMKFENGTSKPSRCDVFPVRALSPFHHLLYLSSINETMHASIQV